ncbi:retrotransposon unclassified-like protein, partial [Trifolium medium]|nr:retrotransposon unclassified-like protein [Trifolium medium]
MEDQIMWPHTKDGLYSVKSGYNLLRHWQNSSNPSSTSSNNYNHIWKKLWNLQTIPRHRVLLWRIINKALPVRSELSKRGVPCIILCPRCLQKEETINHVFMECHHASMIWFDSKLGIRFNNNQHVFEHRDIPTKTIIDQASTSLKEYQSANLL